MTGLRRVELTDDQLLLVRDVALHIAPDQIANRVLRPVERGRPVFLAAVDGLRATATPDTVGLVMGAAALGALAGLAEARIAATSDPTAQAQYVAAKDQASGGARDTPDTSTYLTESRAVTRVSDRIAAEVQARRGPVEAMVRSVRDALAKAGTDDRDGVVQETFEATYQRLQDDPKWLATATVAALLMLAEEK